MLSERMSMCFGDWSDFEVDRSPRPPQARPVWVNSRRAALGSSSRHRKIASLSAAVTFHLAANDQVQVARCAYLFQASIEATLSLSATHDKLMVSAIADLVRL